MLLVVLSVLLKDLMFLWYENLLNGNGFYFSKFVLHHYLRMIVFRRYNFITRIIWTIISVMLSFHVNSVGGLSPWEGGF